MSNAEVIVLALDELLSHEVTLILYGRGALALGFDDPPAGVSRSLDIDVILTFSNATTLDHDENFWEALSLLNTRLESQGLYLTHLFQEDQVILRGDWESHIVPIAHPPTRWLKLFRPHTVDLILTKMMRGADPQDMEDIAFMIRHDGIVSDQMEAAFRSARIPDLAELRSAFQSAQPLVRAMLAA